MSFAICDFMHNTRLLVLEACVQPDAVALLGWAEKEPVEMCFVRGETALRVTKPPFPGLRVPSLPSLKAHRSYFGDYACRSARETLVSAFCCRILFQSFVLDAGELLFSER